jgi:hypothetical protein
LNRTVCLLNLSNKFNIFIGHFVYSIDVHNTNILIVYVVYFVYSKYLGRDEMGIQRFNGRGKTETWEGMRWTFRGIMGEGKWGNGNIHFNFFVDISFSFLLRRTA